jgi:hypothetical protein
MIDSKDWTRLVKGPGGQPFLIPFYFSTDSSNEPTLGEDYDGAISLTATEDSTGPTGLVYTLDVPAWVRLQSCVCFHNKLASINVTPTFDEAAGTVTLTFSAAFVSAVFHGCLFASTSNVG